MKTYEKAYLVEAAKVKDAAARAIVTSDAGVLFILMVTFAPGGIAGLVQMHGPIWRAGRLGRLAGPYLRLLPPALLLMLGFVLVIELCSFLTIGAAQGKSPGVCVWDYDGDGWPDLFVANDTVAGFQFHRGRGLAVISALWTRKKAPLG